MPIPTEPIGSVPRTAQLLAAMTLQTQGRIDSEAFRTVAERAVAETIAAMEATGSPVVTDGEQSKPSFATYPLAGLDSLAPDGVVIPFSDGHTRQLPRLTKGPFRYGTYSGGYVEVAKRYAKKPVKQAVISPSALSLLYPANGIAGYARDRFLDDLTAESVKDIRSAFDAGAVSVQIDFTEGRLSVKLDPSRVLLRDFVGLINRVLANFSESERSRIGVHTCPGGDQDCTHSADVDYGDLLPDLFEINVGSVFMQMASERDTPRIYKIVSGHRRPEQRVFVGVTDPIDPAVETPEIVRDRVLEAASYLPVEYLGTTDDCGFSPFGDDVSTARETAFAKIKARIDGTRMAEKVLGI
ncbi:MAG: 5-methyltetrahydropteroyltriglutamate--homocysteine methyltransferase [Gemmatimonadota bacterium]|nr:5-methyltetrahydropteroyltriglutamate--homocysteine methyltransferase [Gemmatimonadota bacterium]